MSRSAIKLIPNAITVMRLILAAPICLMILSERYSTVLWLALLAGLSDGIDGWLARKLDAVSRFGAFVDPLADKVLLIGAFVSFAVVGLLPWWFAVIVITREAIVVIGALSYYWLYGSYVIAPSFWGKASTCVQIVFAIMLLTQQVYPVFPALSIEIGVWLVILLTLASGVHYVFIWSGKALSAK